MSRMNVPASAIENAGKSMLLPVETEEIVNGELKMVKTKYAAEIVSAVEHTSKSGGQSLKLKIAIDFKFPDIEEEQRVYIEDYLSYSQQAIFKLANVVAILELNPKTLDTTDFEGQFIVVTIKHEKFVLPATENNPDEKEIWSNKIDSYIARYVPETSVPGKDAPF